MASDSECQSWDGSIDNTRNDSDADMDFAAVRKKLRSAHKHLADRQRSLRRRDGAHTITFSASGPLIFEKIVDKALEKYRLAYQNAERQYQKAREKLLQRGHALPTETSAGPPLARPQFTGSKALQRPTTG